MSGMSKSDHINAAEMLLKDFRETYKEFLKEVEETPEEDITVDVIAKISVQQLVLNAAQVHATLANAMRP